MSDEKFYDIQIVHVECVVEEASDQKRLKQKYSEKEFQEEFCIHGLPYRKWCDDCDEYFDKD